MLTSMLHCWAFVCWAPWPCSFAFELVGALLTSMLHRSFVARWTSWPCSLDLVLVVVPCAPCAPCGDLAGLFS